MRAHAGETTFGSGERVKPERPARDIVRLPKCSGLPADERNAVAGSAMAGAVIHRSPGTSSALGGFPDLSLCLVGEGICVRLSHQTEIPTEAKSAPF